MKHLTASTSPSPFSGENWFDPLEDAIRFRVRAFIEAVVAEEATRTHAGSDHRTIRTLGERIREGIRFPRG